MAELIDVLTGVEAVTAVNDDDIISVIRNGELYKISAVVFKGVDGAPGTNGLDGRDGLDGTSGVGVPEGGTEGQLLSKKTASDYDTEWADPPSSAAGIVDLTSATEDYSLSVGETAFIDYASATNVPLHVETYEGLYELVVIGFNISGSVTDGQTKLLPNNANTVNSEVTRQDVDARSTTISSDVLNINYMDVGRGCIYQAIIRVSTFKTSKTTISDSFSRFNTTHSNNSYMSNWINTTTVWESLGTITFPFAQSGKIVIKRII